MYKLNAKGNKWLKSIHLLTVSCWVGGALSLFCLHLVRFGDLKTGGQLHGLDHAAHVIDLGIVVLGGAIGCLLTGLVYSLLTGWGFFKHRWLIVKWIVTVAAIVFGTIALGPWEEGMLAISEQLGLEALNDGSYQLYRFLNFGFGTLQAAILVFLIWVSVFKPWKNSFKEL